jgi:hypothetical protein
MAASSAEAKKILAALPLMSFELDALFAKAKGPRLTLQLPTVSGLPYFLADLPEPAFAAVVALCEAGLLSFATVGAKEGKILLLASGLQPRCPVVTVDAQPGVQYLLPMRLVPGVAAGAPGGGGAGRFFSAGAAGTAFRWGGGARASSLAIKTRPHRAHNTTSPPPPRAAPQVERARCRQGASQEPRQARSCWQGQGQGAQIGCSSCCATGGQEASGAQGGQDGQGGP